jgi:hypothetical protein
MFSGLIGMMQRSCPAADTSGGGLSVIAAKDSKSCSPGRKIEFYFWPTS